MTDPIQEGVIVGIESSYKDDRLFLVVLDYNFA